MHHTPTAAILDFFVMLPRTFKLRAGAGAGVECWFSVDIFNVHYTVKPPENLTVDEIRELANYIDGLMRQLGSRQGTNDPLSRAILVALNLAAQMSSNQVDSEAEIHRIIAKLDQVLSQ